MAPTSRPESQLNLNLSSLSPIVEPVSATSKSPFSAAKSSTSGLAALTSARIGAGSPSSHEQTSRLFPKRARELATPSGVSSNIWGPPTSGTSTPLFEIPESPNQDGFPDLVPLTETGINSPARRGRAGTLPSRISPVGTTIAAHSLTSKTSRPTPSTSPFRPSSTSAAETAFNSVQTPTSGNSALLSRLRAGSMPQRANALNSSNAFGQSPFSSTWASRSRAATLTSIQSAEEASSPQQSGQNKDGLVDPGVRTLDYLGLAETSYPSETDFLRPQQQQQPISMSSLLGNSSSRTTNRFRSFSVNTQPKYSNTGSEVNGSAFPTTASGAMTPSAQAALEAEYEAVQERVRLHNQAVQAFALNANAARPRARTAGLVETPQRSSLRKFGQGGITDIDATDMNSAMLNIGGDANGLADAFYDLNMNDAVQGFDGQEELGMQISRSLWIGSIPNSTTISSLEAIFALYGTIESTRVLTHKNCGFVNYEAVQDAVRARQLLNGKEIFPGAGPVRIGFAKAPNNSTLAISGLNTTSESPTLDPFGPTKTHASGSTDANTEGQSYSGQTVGVDNPVTGDSTANLKDLKSEILQVVSEFGSQQSDTLVISAHIDGALQFDGLETEIATVPELSTNRAFDAPRLRDIRKRIDNGACGIDEIEQIAIDMLPEIAELSSDYLGNTVVQKLFEFCSEPVKEQMLIHIGPHLAEIGVHKNGTWAAQKIIEVCKTESQISMIVNHLRPYTIPLFLDQYGNYVLQCCLKFGSPYNDFIFETMLIRLWDIAQGRFGARAMRACLESHHATKHQQRLLAAVIAIYSVQLATSANGALLLTWLLDTCTFPRRRSVLAPRLIPHLKQLCTHKVAYLTVLKVVNQRNEPEARELVVNALFFGADDSVLEQILNDQASGVTLVFKILTNPFLDDSNRSDVVSKVAQILERIKAQPNQGYKRLMDEVGLSSRPIQPSVPQYVKYTHPVTKPMQNGSNTQYGGYMGNQAYGNGASLGRTDSNESFGYPSYGMNGYSAHQNGYNNSPYQQMTPQNQFNNYQHHVRNNNAYMNNNYAGYATPPSSVDAYRAMPNPGSPLGFSGQMSPLMNSNGFPQQGYGQAALSNNMYAYNTGPAQNPGYYFSPPMQAVHSGGRGRRVR